MHQCMRQPVRDWPTAPCQQCGVVFDAGRLEGGGARHHLFGRLGVRVQYQCFHQSAQLRVEVVIEWHGAGIDDAHVETCSDGVIQEDGMNRFT